MRCEACRVVLSDWQMGGASVTLVKSPSGEECSRPPVAGDGLAARYPPVGTPPLSHLGELIMDSRRTAKTVIWSLVVLLIVLHHDLWFWNDATLLFGFLPITLAYHMGISIAAAAVWLMAIKLIWPLEHESTRIDDSAEGVEG